MLITELETPEFQVMLHCNGTPIARLFGNVFWKCQTVRANVTYHSECQICLWFLFSFKQQQKMNVFHVIIFGQIFTASALMVSNFIHSLILLTGDCSRFLIYTTTSS